MSENNDNSNPPGGNPSGEPSMEEILASIRRILKEDETAKPTDPAPEPDPDEDILLLDETMIIRPEPAYAPEPVFEPTFEPDPTPEPIFEIPEPVAGIEHAHTTYTTEPINPPEYPEIPADQPDPEPMEPPMQDDNHYTPQDHVQPPHGIISESTTEAASSSIGALVRSISSERAVAIGRAGITIEDLVREELRPLLKSWLDTHLPTLVDRIVRAEIERVIDRAV